MTAPSLQRANAGEGAQLAVEIRDLTKSFGRTKALDGLDLTVAPGEITGFLGPNGAGKSTTIRVLLGLLRADGGTVRLLGGDPWRDAVALHRRIAYVPGDVTLWPNLTGLQAIDFLARLRGNGDRHRRRDELIERFELDPHKKARTYSKGNRQKVAIVAAFSTNAELLHPRRAHIRPGPVDGEGFSAMRRGGRRPRRRGAAVQPHPRRGRGAVRQRDHHPRRPRGEIRHARRAAAPDAHHRHSAYPQRRPRPRNAAPFVHDFSIDDGHYRFSVDRNDLDRAMALLTELGIVDLTVTPASLEDMFLREYQGADSMSTATVAPHAGRHEAASAGLAVHRRRQPDPAGAAPRPRPAQRVGRVR